MVLLCHGGNSPEKCGVVPLNRAVLGSQQSCGEGAQGSRGALPPPHSGPHPRVRTPSGVSLRLMNPHDTSPLPRAHGLPRVHVRSAHACDDVSATVVSHAAVSLLKNPLLGPFLHPPHTPPSCHCPRSCAFPKASWSWNHRAGRLSRQVPFTCEHAFKLSPSRFFTAW